MMTAQEIIDQIQANDLVLTRTGRNIDAMPVGPKACYGIPRHLIEELRAQVDDILPLLPKEADSPKPWASFILPGDTPATHRQVDLFSDNQ